MNTQSQREIQSETGRKKPIGPAATAGAQGAALLFGLQLILQAMHLSGPPLGVAGAHAILHWHGIAALALGLGLASLSGAAWGALYGVAMPKFSVWTGLMFGITPWLCATLFALPLLGHLTMSSSSVGSILLALVQLMLWGAFVGSRCAVVCGE